MGRCRGTPGTSEAIWMADHKRLGFKAELRGESKMLACDFPTQNSASYSMPMACCIRDDLKGTTRTVGFRHPFSAC